MNPLERLRLDGRAIVLTGASSGLGVGFARALGAAGARVALVARRSTDLEMVANDLREHGIDAFVKAADVSDPDQCQAVAEACAARFGGIDVLVNNAGTASSTPALTEDPATFRRVLDVNVGGTFWMAQACAGRMKPGSVIVNVSSVLGHIGPRFPHAAYAASKAAVLGLTRDLAQEWTLRKGIRVNALCPGYFVSEMTADGSEAIQRMLVAHSIMPRFGDQAELDSALLFLASDASSYMTGASLVVDGGLSAL